MSALVEELCSAFGIQKCQTMAYHMQCNGQVEHFHQTIFCMIGKLSHNKKAQWKQHLPELLQAYNSTQLAVTGYSLQYLMFGRCLRLPVDYYFPTVSAYIPVTCQHMSQRFRDASRKLTQRLTSRQIVRPKNRSVTTIEPIVPHN